LRFFIFASAKVGIFFTLRREESTNYPKNKVFLDLSKEFSWKRKIFFIILQTVVLVRLGYSSITTENRGAHPLLMAGHYPITDRKAVYADGLQKRGAP
jgi:hypothetical protein